MKQALSFLTLGVKDLEKMKNFYTACFGWQLMKDSDGIVFFKLNGFVLGLFPLDELAADAGVANDGSGFKGVTMAINVGSEQEVDETVYGLQQKGASVVKAPEKVFWGGYRGYIADIENNLWEIAYNPFLTMDAAGNVLEHR